MNSRLLLLVLTTLAALGMQTPVVAADRFWTNSLGGIFPTAANWSPNGVPESADNANFTNNATYQVTWSDARSNASAFFNARSGTVTQALAGFSWLLTNSYVVGQNAGSTATVTHASGTLRVTNSAGSGQLIVGQNGRGTFRLAGSTAAVETDRLLVTNNSPGLANSVFTFAHGTLTTRGDGQINQSTALTVGSVAGSSAAWNMFGGTNTHNLPFGVNLGSATGTGVVSVVGSATVWSNSGLLTIGSSGRGLLLVSNGAMAYSRSATIGSTGPASNSVARVTGDGTRWWVEGSVIIGNAAAGNQLFVEQGARVEDTTGVSDAVLGFNPASSNNLAWVTGTDSQWLIGGGLDIGTVSPANSVTVSNGGTIVASSVTLGPTSLVRNNRLTVTGAGSLFTNLTTLQLGPGAANTLSVSDGGRLDTALCVLGYIDTSSDNLAIVEGSGSRLRVRSSMFPTLGVGGDAPNNTLLVTNGGTVESYATRIGEAASATNNVVVVAGGGSLWTNASGILLGVAAPRNIVELRDGGVATCEDFLIGNNPTSTNNTVILADSGTKMVVRNSFNLGDISAGQRVWVTNGATLFSGTASIGAFSGFPGNEVVVSGTNSHWLNASNNWFMLGQDGAYQTMSVLAGGSVENRSDLFLGRSSTGRTNTLLLAGPGTLWSNRTTVSIGWEGTDNLLVISNGARMTAEFAVIGSVAGAANNTALITGAGSVWTNRSQLDVGVGGSNSVLVVSNGGWVVSEAGFVGGVNGLAWITDVSSVWSNLSSVGVVNSGNRLIVTNGGSVIVGVSVNVGQFAGYTNNEILVTGTGSRLVSGRDLEVGGSGDDNCLIIADGALASCVTGYVGSASSGNLALITGPGSQWSNSACLTLGALDGDFNSVVVSNGATIAAPLVKVGADPSSVVNELTVAGGNLIGTAPNGEIGNLIIGLGFSAFLHLNGGVVTANRLVITNGQFNRLFLNAGVLNVRTSVVNNTQTFFAGSGSNVAVLNLLGGSHSFANGLTIRSNASLTGTGAISGTLTVLTGGKLAPGSSVGRITLFSPPVLHGLAQMEVSKSGSALTNDQVQITTALTYGGALTVTKIGPTALTDGNQFPLFSASSYSGAFSSLTLPTLDSGLMWTNKLLINGSLQVVPFSPPRISNLTLAGTNLMFSGTGGSPGGSYLVLTATDLALPMAGWTSLRTNQFDWLGSFAVTNNLSPGEPQRYFALQIL